jgi:hypothetical protein
MSRESLFEQDLSRRTASRKNMDLEAHFSKQTGRFESPPTLDPQASNNDFEPKNN